MLPEMRILVLVRCAEYVQWHVPRESVCMRWSASEASVFQGLGRAATALLATPSQTRAAKAQKERLSGAIEFPEPKSKRLKVAAMDVGARG